MKRLLRAAATSAFLLFCLFAGTGLRAAVTLQIWEFPRIQSAADPYDRFAWLRRLLKRFEKENPGVRVQLTELTWRQGVDKLKISVFAGAAPDITSGALPLQFIKQGAVLPIDEFITEQDRSDYFPGALRAFTWKGRVWGWPWCSKCDALFINKDLFKERGVPLPANGRWSLSEFVACARRLTYDRDGDGRIDVYGLGFCLFPGRTAEYGFLLGRAGRFVSDDGKSLALVEGETGLDTLGLLRSFVAGRAIAPPSSGGAGPKDVWLAFAERGSVAMIPCGLWALKALRKKHPFDFSLAHFPDSVAGDPLVVGATAGFYVFRSNDRERERYAVQLARFLTNGENQAILKSYGQFPTRRSAGDLYADDPLMARAAEICRHSVPLPPTPAWPGMDETIIRNIQLVVLGEKTVEEAAAYLSNEGRRLFAGAGEPGKPAGPGNESAGAAWMRYIALSVIPAVLAGLYFFFAAGRRLSALERRQELIAYAFILPCVLVIGIFFAYPGFRAVLLAFQEYRLGQGFFDNWVGLENFFAALRSPVFRQAIVNTVVYTTLVVPVNLLTGLVLASLIAPLAARWRHVFRAAFYLPGVTSVVVLSMVWRWLYDVEFGVINRVLLYLGSSQGPARWLYLLVRNLVEIPPHLPRLVLWALSIAALALLVRTRIPAALLRPLDERARKTFGIGTGLAARCFRLIDNAAADMGPVGFLLVTAAAFFLLVSALAAVPWQAFPAEKIGWLTSTRLSLFSIILTMVVRGPGGALIIYMAALDGIPKDLYEVAEIDGAGPLARWWHITLPMLRPTTLFLLVTQTIGSFQVFAQVSLLTDGGPGTSSVVLVHRIYTAAFRDLDFGGASAMALLLFVVIALISGLQFYLLEE